MKKRVISTAAVLALVGAGLSGCIVVPAHRYGYYGPPAYVDEPAYVGPGIWIEGYWAYDGGRRRWVEGHYERHGDGRDGRDGRGRGR